MNKTQVITLSAALSVAALIFGIGYGCKQHRDYFYLRGLAIGHDLLSTTNTAHLVHLDPALQTKLSQFLAPTGASASVAYGDTAPPIGDGRAHVRVFLKNSKAELLGIRLRQSEHSDKFEVLGYWTPQHPEGDKRFWH